VSKPWGRTGGSACLSVLLLSLAASTIVAAELPLVEAIKDQNPKAVATLIPHTDVNARQPDGSTPLSWAVFKNDAATVDLLLKAGAKVTTADDYGETPLTLACANGNAGIVGKLIAAGADVNAARFYNETPLMVAAASGNADVIKALVAHGAKIEEAEARRGQNALMWAAAEGNSDAVAALLKAGAKPNVASKAGFTPLVFVAENGDVRSAQNLIAAGADVNYAVPRASGILLIAITAKKFDVANALIDNGALVTDKDPTGTTPLHTAAELGEINLVKKLIAKGADVNAATNPRQGDRMGILQRPPTGQQTPLMIAARVNRPDIMRVLVEAGANPKLHATDGSTLLMAAASGGHIESVKYAYELDPDIKAMTDRKETVMHASMIGTRRYATEAEITEMVRFLADKGGELDSMDISNRTPIALAKIIPLDTTIDMLTKMIIAAGSTPKPSKAR
jgi:ankyrin repeat protein